MNKKQALQNGYTSTGESGTDWDEMLVKVKAARNEEHHARLITERMSLTEGAPQTASFTVYTKTKKRAARLQAASTASTTATPVLTPPTAISEAKAAVSVKGQKPKVAPKAKKEKGK